MINFIDLDAQHQRLKDKIQANVTRVFSHGKYVLGPEVDELEERLCDYTGAMYCITCGNGTDALFIAIKSLSSEKTMFCVAHFGPLVVSI